MDSLDAAITPAEFYDAVADQYAQLLPDASFEAPLDLGMLQQFIAPLRDSGGKVLDAGCGTGRMLTYLQQHGIRELEGIDVSPRMIEIASSSHPDVALTVGDLLQLPYLDGAFDGVLGWYSIIHTSPAAYSELVRSLRRVLRIGGLLLLAFQEGEGTRTVGRSYAADVSVTAYRHRAEDISAALALNGFEVLACAQRVAGASERDAQAFLLARATPAPVLS
jgi:ubiquinone/menaquinone biosynthesis C-methylase UbiE